MKVSIHNPNKPWKDGVTGKSKFVCRLIPALREQGIEVTEKDEPCDISLHIGRVRHKSKAKKNILRLGPAHISTHENYKKLNKEKAKSLKGIDGVVYQSRFSRKVCRKFIGKPKCPDAVIFNGADPKEFDVEPAESEFKRNFLASTRKWLPQKRLKEIEKAFMLANISDSCLFVCGDTMGHDSPTPFDGDTVIRHLGIKDSHALARLYKLCDAMIHMVYIDACPNSVVEAMVAGCPVICGDQGGIMEFVWGNGWIIPEKPYDFNPTNLLKPPKIKVEHLADVMKPHYASSPVPHLHIDNIAKQYIKFFEKIL